MAILLITFLLIFFGVLAALLYLILRALRRTPSQSRSKTHPPAAAMVDFPAKQAELVQLLDRLAQSIEHGFAQPGRAGKTFTLVPLREAARDLAARARRATHETQLALLFIESRRLYDQLNQVLDLPREFFLRDARQAAADGIGVGEARARSREIRLGLGPRVALHPSGISFWDWFLVHRLLFTDDRGATRDQFLRQGVETVYDDHPEWIDETGGEAIPDILDQLSAPLAEWRSESVEEVLATDWQPAGGTAETAGEAAEAEEAEEAQPEPSAGTEATAQTAY